MNYQNPFNRDFYPTPKSVIDIMMQGEDVTDKIILEPSAGSGNIVQWLVGHGAGCVMACEINDTLRRSLRDCDVIGTDFLDVTSQQVAGIISVSAGIDILSEGDVERSTKIFKRSAVALAISMLGIIFIPSKQDMLLIYGVGTTLDYLQDNEKVQQLPDKCVDALDAWVESLSEEDEK